VRDQWGRVETQSWPGDKPTWTVGVLLLSLTVSCAGLWLRCQAWTPLQQYWLMTYLSASVARRFRVPVSTYRLMLVLYPNGATYIPTEPDVVPGLISTPDGSRIPFVLTEEAKRLGKRLVLTPPRPWNNTSLERDLQEAVYEGQTLTDLARLPLLCGMGLLVFGLPVAISKDKPNAHLRQNGQPLRGPEEVTAAEFNRRNHSDGIGFGTLEPPAFFEKLLRRNGIQLCIPRPIEDNHFLFMGDSGSGKSSLIRQVLAQIAERGETAVVYDPALEYIGQFYSPKRGDVILNPLDQRMPYWSPSEEVTRPSEALTLAASLFQETDRENPFFVHGPRKIFAHLLNLKPTPEELLGWLSAESELERQLNGTALAAMIYESAGPQRGGMFASLSMVADSLRLLPVKMRLVKNFTVAEWAEHRQGWVFVTSIPESREQLRPLISMWLDMMILRLMNQGRPGTRPVWFVLDELSSLHRLPQLLTAITENRKAGNPVVLCFQGRSQLESIYGHQAEAMLSQPATKIFLKTSEPRAAQWISDTLGEVELERLRESRTHGQMPQPRESRSYQLERVVRPLVMKEEITGLPKGHGFFKCGNLVVRISFPYLELPERHPRFLERKTPFTSVEDSDTRAAQSKAQPASSSGTSEEHSRPSTKPKAPADTHQQEEQPTFFK
jgi:hypothetical protein